MILPGIKDRGYGGFIVYCLPTTLYEGWYQLCFSLHVSSVPKVYKTLIRYLLNGE